jgi:molybdate transport system regulatory protein
MTSMKPKFKVWVVFGAGTKFGDGRARLLQLIDELGSISKAVARFGMSYRTAWGYLRELEIVAGRQLLTRTPGRGARGGTRLTDDGREFLKRYWSFRRGIEETVNNHFAQAFTFKRPRKPRRAKSGR